MVTFFLIISCSKSEKNSESVSNNAPPKLNVLDSIMDSSTIGVQKEFFEKSYGIAKRNLYSSIYQYEIGKCFINVEYDEKNSISSIELENISKDCTFDTRNIFLSGKSHELTYADLIVGAMDWQADTSCYEFCGNAADPIYGIHVQMPRANQFIEFEAFSSYLISTNAANNVVVFFKQKYPKFEMVGRDLGPINPQEYNQIWIDNFKDLKLTTLKFGYQLSK
jgi:hypothetical protein